MPSELFPPDFPSELRVAAFRAGDEVAWPRVVRYEWIRGPWDRALAFEGRGNTKPTDGTQRNAGGTRQYGEPWKRRIVEFVCCTRWSGNSHLSSSVQTLQYCRARSIRVQRRLGQRGRIHKSSPFCYFVESITYVESIPLRGSTPTPGTGLPARRARLSARSLQVQSHAALPSCVIQKISQNGRAR